MKSMIVNSICFGVGAAAGIIFTSIYWKKKMDKILAETEEFDDEYVRDDDFEEDSDVEINPREKGPLSKEERDKIKEKLIHNYEKTTSYANMYKGDCEPAEEEHPVDSDEDENVEDEVDRINREHIENRGKPPKIISAEEFSNLPANIETDTLYFYHYDNVLVDENEDEIDEGMLVGDCLDKFGFRESDQEEIIFVMNYQIDKAFEIHRVMGAWHNGDPEVD